MFTLLEEALVMFLIITAIKLSELPGLCSVAKPLLSCTPAPWLALDLFQPCVYGRGRSKFSLALLLSVETANTSGSER